MDSGDKTSDASAQDEATDGGRGNFREIVGVLLICGAVFGIYIGLSSSNFDGAACNRIRVGISFSEAKSILGASPGYHGSKDYSFGMKMMGAPLTTGGATSPADYERRAKCRYERWLDDRYRVSLLIDENNRVVDIHCSSQ